MYVCRDFLLGYTLVGGVVELTSSAEEGNIFTVSTAVDTKCSVAALT